MEILISLCTVYGIMLPLYLPHKGSGHSAISMVSSDLSLACHKLGPWLGAQCQRVSMLYAGHVYLRAYCARKSLRNHDASYRKIINHEDDGEDG